MVKPSKRVIRCLILDFFDELYRDVEENNQAHHCEIRTIYSYLAHVVPTASIKMCYQVIHDVISMYCLSKQSIYPFPDGGPWTDEERERYLAYLHNHDKED